MQQVRDYMDHLGTFCTHINPSRAAFYSFKLALFSTIWSPAAGCGTLQILLHSQLPTKLSQLASGSEFSLAIHAGREAIWYQIQAVLDFSLLSRGIFSTLGFP